MKKLLLLLLLFCSLQLQAIDRNLLQNNTDVQKLSSLLKERTDWVSFPAYTDRAVWERLAPAIRHELIRKGEEALQFDWGIIRATDYLEFTKSGNRKVMEDPQNKREQMLQNLALAELVEGKGRFIPALVDGVWTVSEQSTWVLSAHLPLQKRGAGLPDPDDLVIDLTSGRIGALMSWIHYYFAPSFDQINPLIADRIRREVRTRVLEPYYTRTDLWWMGFRGGMVNNWNVWVNFNVLQCILLMENNPEKRIENVYKTMLSVDKFINAYPDDGGCDEGPSYWGHAGGMLFQYLELLYGATGGKVDLYGNELVKNIGRYIYRAYIADPYVVNFADATAKGSIYPGLVYRYGKAIGDPVMQNFGTFYAQKKNFGASVPSGTLESVIHDLFDTKEILAGEAAEPLIAQCWLPQSEFATARDQEGSTRGFFFAAKGGYNDESHNHNDVGTFILYYNGLPALVDAGVGTYTRQTFSKDRYKIWTMQSGYHNLPVINGADQAFGKQYKATDVRFKSSAKSVDFSLNIAGAYPDTAVVKTWQRGYQLNRGTSFIISDAYTLVENKGNTALHFLTSCKVQEERPGLLKLIGDGFVLQMQYDAAKLTAQTEQIVIEDKRLQDTWGDSLTRIVLKFSDTKLTGKSSITIRKANSEQ